MVKPLLDQLRTKVESAPGLSATNKTELLKLVADLERQTADKSSADAHQTSLNSLVKYVEKLEVAHPELTDLANRIASALSNLGI